MFHIESTKPKQAGVCDKCGSTLIQRDDDKAEVIQKRLKVYHEQTEIVSSFYAKYGKLATINADQDPDSVHTALTGEFASP